MIIKKNRKTLIANMKKEPRLGFSLLELSISLLVIGLLMTAVVKGSDLISQARLTAARELTINSPILKIDGLVLWFETTMPQSFDASETYNGSQISTWYDISGYIPNSPNNATAGNSPTYASSAVNNLPALNFNGSNDYLETANLTATDYSIFTILQTGSTGVGNIVDNAYLNSCVIWSDVAGNHNDLVQLAIGAGVAKTGVGKEGISGFPTLYGSIAVNTNTPIIIATTRLMSSGLLSLYVNGVADGTNATGNSNVLSANPVMVIGGNILDNKYYTGYISEIIIFNQILSDQERQDVERYLGQKWGITVS